MGIASWFRRRPIDPTPRGWLVPEGHLRIVATVGAGPVPVAVGAAVKRLGDYLAAITTTPGERVRATDMGEFSMRVEADPGAIARALIESGAADLLRAWRRL